jgi:L-2-hydroxyglutarate oxidase
VIGAGVVGLATAYRLLQQRPQASILVLEKEPAAALHQTGRNSGVLHSGVYYRPGSHKAVDCRTGKRALEEFCAAEGVPYEICGKVIVATSEVELPRLAALHERARANGVTCELVDRARLRELEPHCAGIQALHVPETGIVDYRSACERLLARIRAGGHRVQFECRVRGVRQQPDGVALETTRGRFVVRCLVNCGGLHSDRLAAASGGTPPAQIVPFRGEYYRVRPQAEGLCRNLIYPVPDPRFPFLGVHFTRMVGGGIECGPNAVLALGREAYRRGNLSLRDAWETLTYRGFHRLARRHWRMGLGEVWRSWWKPAFVRALQRLVPEIRAEHLERAPAGIRAQAVLPTGDLADDFVFDERPGIVNVVNAPSPAATAALTIGAHLAERALRNLDGAAARRC